MKKLYSIWYIIVVLLITHCSLLIVMAQTPTQAWVARYNSPHSVNDRFKDMATDKYGNVYLTGWNNDSTTGNDIITVKINSSGQILWSAVYNSGGAGSNDLGQAIAVDDSGNVYVTGYTGLNLGPYDYITIKYDSNGNEKWEKIYNSGGSDISYAIVVDKTGNTYITGGGSNRTITIKYNMIGDSIWIRKYLGGSSNYGECIKMDTLSNIYIAGIVHQTHFDYYINKYDSTGQLIWSNTNDLGGNCSISDLFIDNLGNGAITGGVALTNYSDYYVIKFSSGGNTLWQRTYNGIGNFDDYGTSVKFDNFGNTFVTGSSWGYDMDYLTIKYNSLGDTVWTRRYNGTANGVDNAYSICLDSIGNSYVTGSSVGTGSRDDFLTIKYSPNGTMLWNIRYNGEANNDDRAGSIFLSNNNSIYVGGESVGIGTDLDLTVIKYNQSIGILGNNNDIPNEFKLYQNFPNPFNSQTVISYKLPQESFVNLSLFNTLGQLVKVIVNGKEQAGNYIEIINSDNMSSGIYFYRISAQSIGKIAKTFFDTRKLIIIK